MGILLKVRFKKLLHICRKLNWHNRMILLSSLLIFLVIMLGLVANQAPHLYKNRAEVIRPTTTPISEKLNQNDDFVIYQKLEINRAINAFKISGKITLKDPTSYIRVVLIDNKHSEYLVYETYPLIAEKNEFMIEKVCDETCLLENVLPEKIRIEGSLSSIEITNISNENLASSQSLSTNRFIIKSTKDQEKTMLLNKYIAEHKLQWKAGETDISKLTYAEKRRLFFNENGKILDHLPNLQGFEYYKGGIFKIPTNKTNLIKPIAEISETPLPSSWDWRNVHGENWNTPVKNQGNCGSCWAFTAVGAVEAQTNLYFNQHLDLDLSEQDLVSCSREGESRCSGGNPFSALQYIQTNGIVSETCFQYQPVDNVPCQKCEGWQNEIVKINKLDLSTSIETERQIKEQLITYGPLAAGYSPWGHAMVVSGWETNPNNNATVWIFKNSWGNNWGENGYAKIETTPDMMGQIGKIILPITITNQHPNIPCVDKDNDSFCNWGISPTKWSTCPLSCRRERDCDDNNPNVGGEAFCNQYLIPTLTPTPIPTMLPANFEYAFQVVDWDSREIINGLMLDFYGRLNQNDDWHLINTGYQINSQSIHFSLLNSNYNDFMFMIVDGYTIKKINRDRDFENPPNHQKCEITNVAGLVECKDVRSSNSFNEKIGLRIFGYIIPTPTPTNGVCQCDIGHPVENQCAPSFFPKCINKFSCECQDISINTP